MCGAQPQSPAPVCVYAVTRCIRSGAGLQLQLTRTSSSSARSPARTLSLVAFVIVLALQVSIRPANAVTESDLCASDRKDRGLPPCNPNFAECAFNETANNYPMCKCITRGYLSDGTVCRKILCPAPTSPPVLPAHSYVHEEVWRTNYTIGQRLIHGCVAGYKLNGIGQVLCGNHHNGFQGIWDPPFSTCDDIDECQEKTHSCSTVHSDGSPDPRNTGVKCENTDGSYTCQCQSGYYLQNGTVQNVTLCRERACDRMSGTIQNGRVIYSPAMAQTFEIGSTRTVRCDPGYQPHPSAWSVCDVDGNWEPAQCMDVDECVGNNNCTSAGTICSNKAGSYECLTPGQLGITPRGGNTSDRATAQPAVTTEKPATGVNTEPWKHMAIVFASIVPVAFFLGSIIAYKWSTKKRHGRNKGSIPGQRPVVQSQSLLMQCDIHKELNGCVDVTTPAQPAVHAVMQPYDETSEMSNPLPPEYTGPDPC